MVYDYILNVYWYYINIMFFVNVFILWWKFLEKEILKYWYMVYIVKELFSINYVYSLKMWWVEILFSVILKILEC